MKQMLLSLLLLCSLNVSAQDVVVKRDLKEQTTKVSKPKTTSSTPELLPKKKDSVKSSSNVPLQEKTELSFDKEKMVVSYGNVQLKMIKVDGGAFMMGAEKEDRSKTKSLPIHYVVLSDFYISETCVPNDMFKAVCGKNLKEANRPDCIEFTQYVKNKFAADFRLPAEAEWEYAARGGNRSKGYKYAGTNYIGNLTPDKKNELGLFDYGSEKYEWVIDLPYHYNYELFANPINEVHYQKYDCYGTYGLQRTGSSFSNRYFVDTWSKAKDSNFRIVLHLDSERDQMKLISQYLPQYEKKVDLGLSVYWAGYNIGANHPEELGSEVTWIETNGKISTAYKNQTIKYLSSKKVVSKLGQLMPAYDRATIAWGDSWRLPTKEEFEELHNKCKWVWLKYEGNDGFLVIGPNGNSIFLPAKNMGAKRIRYNASSSLDGSFYTLDEADGYGYYSYHSFAANYASSTVTTGIFRYQIQNDYLNFKPTVISSSQQDLNMTSKMLFRAVSDK